MKKLCTRGSHVTLFQYVVCASGLGRKLAFEEINKLRYGK